MKNSFVNFLIYFAYCVIISNAVSLCCFRPTVHNDDCQKELPEICDGVPYSDDISVHDASPDTLMGWNYDYEELKREWSSHRGEHAFNKFNMKVGFHGNKYCGYYHGLYVQEFIKQASIEERKNNQNQVIVYHGERMGVWLLQVLAKQLQYPHVKEWLPLRFDQDLADIDAGVLESVIKSSKSHDHSPEFTAIGLSAHVNLMSQNPSESAALVFSHWSRFSGCSGRPVSSLLNSIGIPESQHEFIEDQLIAIMHVIGWKMKWRGFDASHIEYQKLFPSLNQTEKSLIQKWRAKYRPHLLKGLLLKEGMGVILQIVMPPEMAIKYSYAAGPFGKIKDQPFLEYYTQHKNKLDDDGQLRIAMGHPFTRYPSSVKIKALSPIFKENDLMHLIVKMMKDIVESIK